uniref:BUD13 homolog n=1 Tax=Erpetoichthys calabaricus TaxID=27687 RepID=A0A8C4SAE9_ERPCA
MAAMSKAEYLQRYMTDGDEKEKKKKKRSKAVPSGGKGMKIVDDDVDWKRFVPVEMDGKVEEEEEAPVVAEVVDERPKAVRLLEEFRSSMRWKLLSDQMEDSRNADGSQDSSSGASIPKRMQGGPRVQHRSPDVSVSRRSRHDSPGPSPPRKGHRHDSPDLSPPRMGQRHDSPDLSPPRMGQRHDSPDLSPPRKGRHDSPDLSPPRKGHRRDSPDLSPPRKGHRRDSPDLSPPRKGRHDSPDLSPPRKGHRRDSPDLSPPRKRRQDSPDLSPPRKGHRRDSPDWSPLRKRRQDSPDRSPPRSSEKQSAYKVRRPTSPQRLQEANSSTSTKNKPNEHSPVRRKSRWSSEVVSADSSAPQEQNSRAAGLLSSEVRQKEKEENRRRERADKVLEAESRQAETVVRDKSGKKKVIDQEQKEDKEKAEKAEKYAQWGKGLAQGRMQQYNMEEALKESQKPLARHIDDEDIDKMLREQEREGDPMAGLLRKKKEKEDQKKGIKERPKYKGPAPPPTRYNIQPGYRWDGVDRSNGFEKRLYSRMADKKATQEIAYKWSVENM